MVLGVDPESENAYSHISDKLVQGEFIASGQNAVLVGGGLAQYLRLKIGDELVLYGAGYRGQTAAGCIVSLEFCISRYSSWIPNWFICLSILLRHCIHLINK